MKFNLFVLIFLICVNATSSFATSFKCLDTLTLSHNENSRVFNLNLDDYEIRDYGSDELAKAISLIRIVIKEEGCSRSDINFSKGPVGRSRSRCSKVVSSVDSSLACYVETNLGSWFVSYDFLENAKIIFNRWD